MKRQQIIYLATVATLLTSQLTQPILVLAEETPVINSSVEALVGTGETLPEDSRSEAGTTFPGLEAENRETSLGNEAVSVGKVLVDNGVKFKVLSLGEHPTVQLGNGLYPIEFKSEQDGQPYTVPSQVTIDGTAYTVTAIGEEALAYYADESGMLTYYPSAITIPKGVTLIKKNGFKASNARTIAFEAGSQLQTIEDGAFSFTNLQSFQLPASVETIGNRVFNFNESLKSFTFEEGSRLNSIGNEVFSSLPKLEELTLPKTLKNIGEKPFALSSGLKAVYVAEGNDSYESQDGVLYTKGLDRLIYYPAQKPGDSFTTPNATKALSPYAFNNNTTLKKITLGEGIEEIPTFTFATTINVESIALPTSLKKIGRLAFYEDMELKELTIPNQVSEFEVHPFNGLPKLEKITFGKGVTHLPANFLSGNLDSLKEIHFLTDSSDWKVEAKSLAIPAETIIYVQEQSIADTLKPHLEKGNKIIVKTDTGTKTEVKTEIKQETIPFDTKEEQNPALPKGERRIKTKGQTGEVAITYEVTYTDGVETSRKEISRQVVKAAVTEVVEVGTKELAPNPLVSTKEEVLNSPIPFDTKEEQNPALPKGKRRIKTKGQAGEVAITYEVTYTDGVETSRKEIGRQVVKAAVTEVVEVGTKEIVGNTQPSEGNGDANGMRQTSSNQAKAGDTTGRRVLPQTGTKHSLFLSLLGGIGLVLLTAYAFFKKRFSSLS
ncbi:LPXTG-motif cell wall-anchored protein [Streptococcus rupicaprae]|uniref:LPXTG-motif cell wall-anchored protein n=1 Tax=Streptococcus rupicaprae TaxID=759619 RepID=A0ABV2FEP2_9STRE